MSDRTFSVGDASEVLRATPATVRALVGDLSKAWTASSSNPESWGVFDIVGHLVHGEETDWIRRSRIILEQSDKRTFETFDRTAMFERSSGKTLDQLIDEFATLREKNVGTLLSWNLTDEQLDLRGVHPELGEVTLKQLLATWVAHDLTHLRQIVTVMAKRYDGEVGPWRRYLSILN